MIADVQATGGCLCGEIRYAVHGPLRDVIVCHCGDCRRWHGHASAMSSAHRDDVSIDQPGSVRWFTVPGDGLRPRRGFCPTCGSSLLWDAPERSTIGIAAGTMDPPTGLRTSGHVYVSKASDYEVFADGLPQRADAAAMDAALPPT